VDISHIHLPIDSPPGILRRHPDCPFIEPYNSRSKRRAKMEDAGEYFRVSSLAIRSHLVNNDILPFDVMDIDSCHSVA